MTARVRHGLYHRPVILWLFAASPYRLNQVANNKSVLRENSRVDRPLPPHVGFRARSRLDPATGGSPWLFVGIP
jgi:hypothetical protein